MSRVAKTPIIIPNGVDIKINSQVITIKGNNGTLSCVLNNSVEVKYINNILTLIPRKSCTSSWAQAGTARALLYSMIIGVTEGFTKKLQLVGVGYRVTIIGSIINLSLGFSHSIEYQLPDGVSAKCPSQTDIILTGASKQEIGQVAADLRSYHRPEPYKGKGIRYDDEIVRLKETKKK